MAVKGAKNKRMTKEEKAAKEARKAVVCNQPGTNPTMFYYTERCILKEASHKYRRTNRRAATFQKRAIKEYETIAAHIKNLKLDLSEVDKVLLDKRMVVFRTKMLRDMINPENMKRNTSPIRRYERLFKDADSKFTGFVSLKGFERMVEKIILLDVHNYFVSVASSMYGFSTKEEDV